jgi:adenylosuccinate lyase
VTEPRETQQTDTGRFGLFSPTDFRYSVAELIPYLSESASISYQARVEAALARELAREGICSDSVASEIESACQKVRAEDVYDEENRIKHETRALVNVIREKVSERAKPFVHLTATSFDIVDTANSLRYKEAISNVLVPDLLELESALIELSKIHADTPQIGRTHGQHAEPITFGFFLSLYVSRLGGRIRRILEAAEALRGKFSGAVGVYGPLSLAVKDPERFESNLLKSLGLLPGDVSTQIVQPEPISDLAHAIISAFGVIANLARDMRNLQRTEVAEVSEGFAAAQVGSSTMPQKRNPISFENAESLWKKFVPEIVTVYLDQISEHQRDLTNSASERYFPELLVVFDYTVRRMTRTIWDNKTKGPKLLINKERMRENLERSANEFVAEPLYVLLALSGHPDAHEQVRKAIQEIKDRGNAQDLIGALRKDEQVAKYLGSLDSAKLKILKDPSSYRGIARQKTISVAEKWEKEVARIRKSLQQGMED